MNVLPIAGARTVAAAFAFAIAAGVSSLASSAVQFNGSYQVNALTGDPGLVVQTAELADPLNFSLNGVGDSHVVDLFDIWTDECCVNLDDLNPAGISVDFTFTAPPSAGSVSGTTVGGTLLFVSGGILEWSGPEVIDFGTGGQLGISLTGGFFNVGAGTNFTPGREHGLTVEAKFKLLSEPSEVPLPASLPLLMAALAGFGLLHRRNRLA